MNAVLSLMVQSVTDSVRTSLRVPFLLSRLNKGSHSEFSSSTNTAETVIDPEMRHFMIVGLGNHGMDGTRHNVGMMAVDRLAARLQLDWQKSVGHHGGFICSTVLKSGSQPFKVTLLKPKTFMNISGTSVAKAVKALSVALQDIYLVHDELDRNLGKFHIKERGSAGGHNGVLSCISCLGSDEILRLRIGISRPACKSEIITYVLSKFSDQELAVVGVTIDQAIDALLRHMENRLSETVT
ncbi:unnamed protein product [Candidula unifasciata]|uniref:Peptidyl-tRNA hydrolase n=1 Tax=Candidula unifasciata TaxID=100452 RepID=A0A8S3YJ13_9EUPU|nr:unnamed protein product [Candidula unifasciata]